MQDPSTPTPSPAWRDPVVLTSVAASIFGAVVLMPYSALPLRAVLEVVLLPMVMAIFLRSVGRLPYEREQAFWIRLGRSFLFVWLAALFAVWPEGLDIPRPVLDSLRMLGLLPIALALDLRPHRQQEESPQLLRQVQLTAVFLTLLVLIFYVILAPRWALERQGVTTTEWALSELFFAVILAVLALRRRTLRWRTLYGTGALIFALRAWAAGAPEAAVPLLVALVAAAAWTRLRHVQFAELSDPPRKRLFRFEVPVVIMLPIVPALHLFTTAFDINRGHSGEFQNWLALSSLAILAPIAGLEYVILHRRRSRLELEHRRAADATVERSVYLDSLIEHSPLAIVVLNPEHQVQLINPAFEKLFGYRSEDVVGSTLDVLISTDLRRSEASNYTRKVLEGRSVHVTTRRSRHDGTELDVELYGVPLMRDGQLIGIFAIYQDVTDRLRAERARKESEERFRRLADASFEGIVVSESGKIIDCNEQYVRLIGGEPQDVIGRPLHEFVTPQDRRLVQARLDQGIEQPYEYRALKLDGSHIVVQVHGRSVPYEGREVLVTAVRDMTEQKRLEDEVRQSQKMEAVGRLAGGIAHDFNNLLTVIKGYAQLLSMQLQPGKPKSLVEEILQASERASLMTQRLLAFGRKQPVQPQNLDLNGIISGMEKILRRLVRADIAFDIRLADDLGRVKADPSQIEQVILNLAINASDAMPQGGTLSLETSQVEITESDVQGPLTSPGSYIRLAVTDTGLGMDRSTLQQVFEPFFTTKEKGKGTGLGLATVYAIVKQSGGTIDVESEPGSGTAFRIFLPRILAMGIAGPTTPNFSALPRGEETVLVVEDQPGVRALAVEFLEQQGYRVVVAHDGRDGLRQFEKNTGQIDLVLTDVVMPEMNGRDMVKAIRRSHPETKVLFMSGYTDEMLGSEGPALNDLLVQKPFSVEELVNKVRQILDGKAPEGPSSGDIGRTSSQ